MKRRNLLTWLKAWKHASQSKQFSVWSSRRVRCLSLEQCESRRLLAELSGSVYVDSNDNGIRNATEIGIPGITIQLTGTTAGGSTIQLEALTDQGGNYAFVDLEPGDYQIRQVQPDSFNDGQDAIGTQGGTAEDDLLQITGLLADDVGRNNDFGEVALADGQVSKRFFMSSSDFQDLFRDLNADALERNGDLDGANAIRNATTPSIIRGDGTTPDQPNRSPDLAPIPNQSGTVGQQLLVPLSATDPDGDNLTFIIDQDGSPDGGSIVDTGSGPQFQFTPQAGQEGQTLTFIILTTDDGVPPLSDREELVLIVDSASLN